MRFIANRHNQKALALNEEGELEKAIASYHKAIKADPTWAVPWYNLGLLYKYEGQWAESLECNQQAAALDPEDDAAWWNLGIAATALADWDEARRAWQQCELTIPAGTGPIEANFGLTPIRLAIGEVIWCRRIDPARAIVESVPLPDSEHRYGDLLLHDGAPNGYRNVDGKDVPVFDELALLSPSEYGTFEVEIERATEEEIDQLVDLAGERKLAAEDWSTVRTLCRACSEGNPDEHEHHHEPGSGPEHRVGIAALSEKQVRELLVAWQQKFPHAIVSEIDCVLAPAWIN